MSPKLYTVWAHAHQHTGEREWGGAWELGSVLYLHVLNIRRYFKLLQSLSSLHSVIKMEINIHKGVIHRFREHLHTCQHTVFQGDRCRQCWIQLTVSLWHGSAQSFASRPSHCSCHLQNYTQHSATESRGPSTSHPIHWTSFRWWCNCRWARPGLWSLRLLECSCCRERSLW